MQMVKYVQKELLGQGIEAHTCGPSTEAAAECFRVQGQYELPKEM